jgi:alpha-glucosidase
MSNEWWRSAVIYQVYPRSFADASGDGIGDLAGITQKLPHLQTLGVDAVWLSPFYTSPQRDAGYDVADYTGVDPLFGTIEDFDAMQAEAKRLGLKVIVDLVPNHSSSEHEWFKAAITAGPGSAERARYIFRDGRGENGDLPPNNWLSVFGGTAWTRITNDDGTPGQWYLHLFDSSQPDFDWTNPEVHELFRGVLRFWLDRGVDGFRVDVAHGMVKQEGLPDVHPLVQLSEDELTADLEEDANAEKDVADADPLVAEFGAESPYWGQEGVHEIFRDWHNVLAEYEGDRVLVAEAWVSPLTKLAKWVRPDEMSQAFNFGYLETPWDAAAVRTVIDDSIAAFGSVGAPSTWVLSNHDVIRHTSRFSLEPLPPQGAGVGPKTPAETNEPLGLARGRAATTLMLALPGSAYLYQGEELGLPEVIHLPDHAREDPTFHRTGGELYGRDGCRVPIPWTADGGSYGFSPNGASWLPQPEEWARYARDAQEGVEGSTLELYKRALALRAEHGLGTGEIAWLDGFADSVLAFTNGELTVVANLGAEPAELPAGDIVLDSGAGTDGVLPPDTTVWIRTA